VLKANPNKFSFGSAGNGTSQHISGELFKIMTGTQMQHIPYKGSGPMIPDLLSGTIQLSFENITTAYPQVKAGKLKALAVTSSKRSFVAPEVPTMAEAGGPPLESSTWVLFMAPGGTPRAIVERLAAETAKAINESEIKTRFNDIGIIPVGNNPAQAQQFLDAEVAKWAKVITAAGVKAEQ
jgi:tripartite-type tricarboxylate transporter receptor subunit TctC